MELIGGKYSKEKKLSSNFDRKVYIVKDKNSSARYICKKLKLDNKEKKRCIENEVNHLERYSNKKDYPDLNIVGFIEKFEEKSKTKGHLNLFIIMELYEGDLTHLKEISYTNVIYLSIKMLLILKQFDKDNIVHRDIKPDNIFFKRIGVSNYGHYDYEFYLGDFGISKEIKTQEDKTIQGTNAYLPPEAFEGTWVKSDIYGLGKTLLELDKKALKTSHNNVYSKIFEQMSSHKLESRPTIDAVLDLFGKIFYNTAKDLNVIKLLSMDYSHIKFADIHQQVMTRYINKIKSNNNSSAVLNIKFDTINSPLEQPFKVVDNIECYNILFSIHLTDHLYLLEKDNDLYLANLLFSCDDLEKMKRLEHYLNICKKQPYSDYLVPGLQVYKIQLEKQFLEKSVFSKSTSGFIAISPFHLENSYKNVLNVEPSIVITEVLHLNVFFKIILFAFEIMANEDDPDQLIQFFFNNFNIFNMLFQYNRDGSDCDIRFSILSNLSQIRHYTEHLSIYNTAAPSIFYSDFKSKDIGEQVFDQFLIVYCHDIIKKSSDYLKGCSFYSPPFNSILLLMYKQVILANKDTITNSFAVKFFNRLEYLYSIIISKRNYPAFNDIVYGINHDRLVLKVTNNSTPILIVKDISQNTFILVQHKYSLGNQDQVLSKLDGFEYLLNDTESVLLEHGRIYKAIKPSKKFMEYYKDESTCKKSISRIKSLSMDEKIQLFYKMAYHEIRNQVYFSSNNVEYNFEMIFIQDQIFYIHNINSCCKNIMDSIIEIGKYVFGEEKCELDGILDNLFFKFNSLSLLYDYGKLAPTTHSRIVYQPSNGYSYLNSSSYHSTNITNYSTITIGSKDYIISNIQLINQKKDGKFWDISKSMVLILSSIDFKENYYCYRKQDKKDLNQVLEFNHLEPKSSKSINPSYIIQDTNTSYQFFKFDGKTSLKSIDDINQMGDYSDIRIIRCLLLYIEYLIQNPNHTSLVVFIKSNSILPSNPDETTKPPEYTVCFDILYFLKNTFGINLSFSKWGEFLESFKSNTSLLSNYFQNNLKTILNDQISLDIVSNIASINKYIKLYNIDILSKFKEGVDLVRVTNCFSNDANGKICVRKVIGSLKNKIDECFQYGGVVSEITKNKNNDLRLHHDITVDSIANSVFIDTLKYQYKMEADILEELKGEEGIVQMIDHYTQGDTVYILLEYCEDAKKLSETQISNQDQLIDILKQMCSILKKLEEKQVIHYDIKEDNILIQEIATQGQNAFKLTLLDFGIANRVSIANKDERLYYSIDGTLGYQAPEIYNHEKRSLIIPNIINQCNKFDIYSLGCTITYLQKKSNIQIQNPKFKSIIDKMTSQFYDKRIDLTNLIKELHSL